VTSEPFEYAIRKDVRNNPIVREIDRDRHRELWRSTLVGLFVVAVFVFSVWHRLELLRQGQSLDSLQKQLALKEQTLDRLSANRERLQSPKRIEREAKERLHMVFPDPADSEVIPRVKPGSPPPRTAVASR
jgi:cell division protein FtsL